MASQWFKRGATGGIVLMRELGKWQEAVILRALDNVEAIPIQEKNHVAYDAVLAAAVLKITDDAFPNPLQTMEIKASLDVEPSDSQLMTAIDALLLEGYIDGPFLRNHMSGKRQLAAMANILITPKGREKVQGKHAFPISAPPIHQFINYGQAGAMGPNSVGTVNYQQQWEPLEKHVDLALLEVELQNVIDQKRQSASSGDEFQQLALLAQAKEQAKQHDGSKLLETLSNMGASVLPILAKAGANGLVAWLEHKLQGRL